MRTAGKVWGQTTQIERNPTLELNRIEVRAGHKCSEHLHRTKCNGFYVVSGVLRVTVWKDDSGTTDTIELTEGQWLVVEPGDYHQFEALDDVVALELYWTQLDPNDIVRRTFGE